MADFTTPEGQVRLIIGDTDPDDPWFSDDEIKGFLALAQDNPTLAAAKALRNMAVSEVLIAKKIRTQDLQTDGPAVGAALLAHAKALEDEVAGQDSYFEVMFPTCGGLEAEEFRW